MTVTAMSAMMKKVHKRAGKQEQKWQIGYEADQMGAVFGDEKVGSNQGKPDKYPFRSRSVIFSSASVLMSFTVFVRRHRFHDGSPVWVRGFFIGVELKNTTH